MNEPNETPRARLLIVDDQAVNIRVIAEALRDRYELFFATSGAQALAIADRGGIDLVLLDVVMPEMDGFEVCRRLREEEKTSKIPVIFVTAREEVEDETRGFDVGGVDYITKPIRPPIVRARVRNHLELKESRDLLERLASIDALTGVPNRRQFDAALEHEWSRAARAGQTISLALLDVDDFKKYNDTYGHARGDDCLRSVARALAVSVHRPGDVAARYGGEEFGIIAPETDANGMRELLAGLLHQVADLEVEHKASRSSNHVTISVGAISMVPSRDDSASAALATADRLLYEAKERGRNRAMLVDARSGDRVELEGRRSQVDAEGGRS